MSIVRKSTAVTIGLLAAAGAIRDPNATIALVNGLLRAVLVLPFGIAACLAGLLWVVVRLLGRRSTVALIRDWIRSRWSR